MTAGIKPCAACGAPVADVALGRGAIEGSDGKRYCSPCAAKLKRAAAGGSPAAAAPARTPTPKPAAPPAPAGDEPITVLPLNQPQPAKSARPAAPAPARRTTSTRVLPKKPSSAAKPGAKAVKGAANGAANGAKPGSSQRVSRRSSVRVLRPWHHRLNKAQLVAMIGGGVLLLVLIGTLAAVAVGRGQPEVQHPPVQYDCHASQLLGEADALYRAGKLEETLKKLDEAAAEADRGGRPDLAQKARQLSYGLRFKTVH